MANIERILNKVDEGFMSNNTSSDPALNCSSHLNARASLGGVNDQFDRLTNLSRMGMDSCIHRPSIWRVPL